MEMVATCFVPATSAAAGISTTRCSAANIICRPSFLGSPTTARVRRIRSCELSRERTTTATLQDHGFSFSPEDFSGKMEKLVQSMNADHDHRRNRAGVITGLSLAGDGGGDSGCPVKRVFSSTVFIIGVVQSFVLRLREVLFYQDLEQIIRHVQSELHTSFVWLFQSIFSHTPTLMVYLLIFLANFTVFSIYKNPVFPAAAATVTVSEAPDASKQSFSQFDRQIPKSIFQSAGRTASIGGGDGGGKPPPVAGAMEDGEDGWSLHEGRRQLSLTAKEKTAWEAMVEGAAKMMALDQSAMHGMVSPVKLQLESDDDYAEYLRTELPYHSAVAEDPDNRLLLSNFAQFLLAVRHDHNRAAAVQPADAAAIGQYAVFLWVALGDLEAAEGAYLEAIAADPGNTYYAANYAHFLWNTGGEDTCFPLEGDGDDDDDVGGCHCHGGWEL